MSKWREQELLFARSHEDLLLVSDDGETLVVRAEGEVAHAAAGAPAVKLLGRGI